MQQPGIVNFSKDGTIIYILCLLCGASIKYLVALLAYPKIVFSGSIEPKNNRWQEKKNWRPHTASWIIWTAKTRYYGALRAYSSITTFPRDPSMPRLKEVSEVLGIEREWPYSATSLSLRTVTLIKWSDNCRQAYLNGRYFMNAAFIALYCCWPHNWFYVPYTFSSSTGWLYKLFEREGIVSLARKLINKKQK